MTNEDYLARSRQEQLWLNRYPASLQHAAAAAFGVSLARPRATPTMDKPAAG